MSELFGTDGVRGVAGTELTCELAFALGKAGAYVLSKEKGRPKILIGNDSRISGDMLESCLISGICSMGGDVYLAGTITTPAIAYLTRHKGFDAGVMISASHNPMEYNGIKFFDKDGYKLPDTIQDEIEDIILKKADLPLKTGADIGRRYDYKEGEGEYVNFICSTTDADLSPYKVVLDCANGASSFVAEKIFGKLGAQVVPMHNKPTGTNINDACGSTHPEALTKRVVQEKADIGLAFDGDADRLIAVDETGTIVDGDKSMAICADFLKNNGKLKNNTLVVTVMSNMGLFKAMEACGIDTAQTGVGDRYVLEEMQKSGHIIGGEQSGHIIFLEHSTTGDGILSAVQLMTVMAKRGKKLSQLASIMEIWPQVLVNAKVQSGKQNTYREYDTIVSAIEEYNHKYDGNGRLLIRASGTEPLIRVMIEGRDKEDIERDAKALADLIEKTIR